MPRRRLTPPAWSPRLLALVVLAWTLVSWGGRIGLLGEGDSTDTRDLARIGGSLLVGWVTGGVLWWAPERLRGVRWLFVAWTVVLWGRSLVVTWLGGPSLAFGVVHTVLAVSWFALAWLVAPVRPVTDRDAFDVPVDAGARRS